MRVNQELTFLISRKWSDHMDSTCNIVGSYCWGCWEYAWGGGYVEGICGSIFTLIDEKNHSADEMFSQSVIQAPSQLLPDDWKSLGKLLS